MTSDRWERIQSLFFAASELDTTERAGLLDAACPDDPSIRREVEELLRAEQRAGAHWGPSLSEAIAAAASEFVDDTAAARTGEAIGPYRLVRELGRGGMGTVYLAERADDQYRGLVAIKFMRGGLAAPDLQRRFRIERQVLANLTHPSIARLLDAGMTSDGTPYLVMEYVEGEPIDVWCDRRGLGIPERVALFRTACAPVQHAHQALVVHRDIKPSNILVMPDSTAKLVDFGIAKLLADEDDAEATATLRFLTPSYAAPEQVRGGRITAATDVYALGGVLYKLLTGRTPFDLADVSAGEVERLICESDPQPPSVAARSSASPRRELEGDLDTIVLKALHKDPARRYASVEQMTEDLRRQAEGLPVRARPDTVRYRAGKFVRRHRAGVTTAAGILIGIGGLTAFYTVRLARERDRARIEATKAVEISRFLTNLFQQSNPRESRGRDVTARELLDRGAERVDRELAGQPAVQGTLLGVMTQVYVSLGFYDDAVRSAEQALRIRRELYGDIHPEVGQSTYDLAHALFDKGDYAASEARYRDALRIYRALHRGDAPEVSRSLEGLGFVLSRTEQLDEAEITYREALAMERRLGAADGRIASILDGLASTVQRRGDYTAAVPLYEEAVALVRRQEPIDSLTLATAINNLSLPLVELGRYAEAEPLSRQALAIYIRFYGEAHPFVSTARVGLSRVLIERGQLDEAKSLALTALAHDSVRLGAGHATIATRLGRIGTILIQQRRFDEAEGYLRRALDVRRAALGPDHPYTAISMNELAGLHRASGDLARAEAGYRETLALRRRIYSRSHPYLAFTLTGLGDVLVERGRAAEAEPLLREALAIREEALPPGHFGRGETESLLGAALALLGRHAEAERLLVSGYQTVRDTRGIGHPVARSAAERLIRLYETTGRPADAARYRALHPD